jgi:transposase-like protein
MSCPRCSSLAVTKDGTTQLGEQRFRCRHCARRFTRRSTSAFSGRAFQDDIIALAVRWYVRYRLSYAEVSEWLAERGVAIDQSTIYRQPSTARTGEASVQTTRPASVSA